MLRITLSEKKNFITSEAKHFSPLTTKMLYAIRAHYFKKHGIKIYIAGETKEGRSQLLENKKNFIKYVTFFKETQFQHAFFVKQHLIKQYEISTLDNGLFYISARAESSLHLAYEEIVNQTKKFQNGNQMIKDNLSNQEVKELNDICIKLQCKLLLDKKINEYIKFIDIKTALISLTKEQFKNEVNFIQRHLKSDEIVGYIFSASGKNHKEGLILTKNDIIKPYISGGNMVNTEWTVNNNDFPEMYTAEYYKYGYTSIEGWVPFPQGDGVSCGALAMLYLKELLKNNAYQLHHLSLHIPVYNQNTLKYLFITSPYPLRYAQSSFYNRMVEASLQEPDFVEIKKPGYHGKVTTIKHLLVKTLSLAIENKNDRLIAEIQSLITFLPIFQKRWLIAFQKVYNKRALMDDSTGRNHYLHYHLHRFYHTKYCPDPKTSQAGKESFQRIMGLRKS